jgi:hypothetical protein
MAAHHDLVRRLHEDDALRDAVIAAPTRQAKQDVVRAAGLAVPDHHDVLTHVAGGELSDQDKLTIGVGGGLAQAVGSATAAAAAAAV